MGTITTFPPAAPSIPVSGTYLGYAQVTANQGGMTGTHDLTGLSVTVTVPEGRRLRISGYGRATNNTAACGLGITIAEDTTALESDSQRAPAVNEQFTLTPIVVISPSAGIHTYKLRGVVQGGGTATLWADATYPAWLLVEDITNTPQPYPAASVPVGQLGYAQVTGNLPITTAQNDLPGLSVNVTVPAGRTLRVTFHGSTLYSASALLEVLTRIKMDGAFIQLHQATLETGQTTAIGTISAIVSPSAGNHVFTVTSYTGAGTANVAGGGQYPTYLLVEDITSTPAPANTATSSTLAYALQSSQTTFTTTDTALPGMSATVTVPAGRRLRVTVCASLRSSVTNDLVRLKILEDAVEIGREQEELPLFGANFNVSHSVIVTPTAGAHTYSAMGARVGGTGTITSDIGNSAYILVEDITGASAPVPAADIIGAVIMYAGSVAPSGWLICDGAALSTAVYPHLFAVLGYMYGGSGGTFNLPNLKGRVPVGLDPGDTDFDVLGEMRGAKTHALTTAELASHNHTQNPHGHGSTGIEDNTGIYYNRSSTRYYNHLGSGSQFVRVRDFDGDNGSTQHVHTVGNATATNQAAGSGTAHNNIQPSLVMNYIIKAVA